MKSIFEDFQNEFTNLDVHSSVRIGLTVAALLVAALVAIVLAQRKAPTLSWRAALRQTVTEGLIFPLVVFLLMFGLRILYYGDDFGAVPNLVMSVFGGLAVIRFVGRGLRSLRPNSLAVRNVITVVNGVVWLGLVFHLTGLLSPLLRELEAMTVPIGQPPLSLLRLLTELVLIGAVLLGTLWLSSMLEQRLMQVNMDVNLRLVLSRVLRAGMFVMALLIALSAAGLDLTVLSVFSGTLGVGLALGLQRIAANYVSGFAMLLERSFRVGDNVKIDNFEGRITDIKTRYTVVRALNGVEAVVPNEFFMVQRVEQLSLNDRLLASSTVLQVDYETDIDLARHLMVEAALQQSRVLRDPGPTVMLSQFAADGIDLTLVFWLNDPENGINGLRSDINLAIWRVFRENNISIPWPQRVVHIVNNPSIELNSSTS